jgi:hypothetical protein|nr:MAG TPA: hypothetical protein [Caudoviricetes sp.]
MNTAKTIVVLFDYLNAHGTEGHNAKKRVKNALQREHICWKHGNAWLVYLPAHESVEGLEDLIAGALGAVSLRLGLVVDNESYFVQGRCPVDFHGLLKRFGGYVYEGKVYCATRQMELSNRYFPGCYQDAEDGMEYLEEWSAPGYDTKGEKVELFMRFRQVKGQEVEPENLNWSKYLSHVIYL